MKRILTILLLIATLLSAFSLTAFADDNATSGEGTTHAAADGFGWYNGYQYMWKVTVYVGKKDTVTKQSSLTNDFYRIGTVIMKKTGWTLSSKAIFGDKTKVDYYGGQSMVQVTNPYALIEDAACPKIPIACGGDIGTVKEYFGSTGTMNTILSALATKNSTTPYGLLSAKKFTIGGQNKSGWDSSYILPNGTSNRVPWVIVYEPVIMMHLKDKVTLCAFTATEYALAQQYGWYDWNYSRGTGQSVAILPFRHLPTSVQLEESWFGYPVYAVTDDTKSWAIEDIIKGGGWGMRWLDLAVKEQDQIDYGCYFTTVETPKANGYGKVSVTWKNYKNVTGTVRCELYRDSTLIWSGNKTFSSGQAISQTFNVLYPGTSQHTLTAKINYANRSKETDPNDNMRVRTVTPEGVGDIDYGAYIYDYDETPNQDTYGEVTVEWWNFEDVSGTVLCELYRDSTRVWYGYKTIDALSYVEQTYKVYYSGTTHRTLTAKINYDYRNDETDPNDNIDSVTVKPKKVADTTYDFSVSNLTVSPNPITQGETATISFVSDNWNKDKAYSNILVELLVGDKVVKSEYVSFSAYGRNTHTYTVQMTTLGDNTVTARINWANRNLESRVANNSTSKTVTVNPYYEFSVSNISVSASEVDIRGNVTVKFTTDNWDRYNAYDDIPVELLYNGKVVYSAKFDYSAYARKSHSVTINVGDNPGSFPIIARVNWADHTNEAKTDNNATTALYVKVKDSLDLSILYVTPNSDYHTGKTVVTSYRIYNTSKTINVIPKNNNTVSFEAYYYLNGVKTSITTMTWKQAVVPANDNNLVWFKWTVPDIPSGTTIYCKATVNSGNTITEKSTANNTTTLVRKVVATVNSQTPDTQYEREAPSNFKTPTVPTQSNGRATWTVWEYENNAFVKKTYGIGISSNKPSITPDKDITSAEYKNLKWYLASGYGYTISYSPYMVSLSGYSTPAVTAYTGIQEVKTTFPEFSYSKENSEYRVLEYVGSIWSFIKNDNADGQERLHFTPIWYPNGNYTVATVATEVWTPAGMIESTKTSNTIIITDSAYDDWHISHN